MTTHPGVYCLRSNETDWSEATLWRTYTTLTDLEAVFRSLKSELGLRPIYHRKPLRAEGHLFITVIAYQLVSGRSQAPRGARSKRMPVRQLDHLAPYSRRAPARYRDVQACRWAHFACAQGDAGGARAASDPQRAGHRVVGWRDTKDDRLSEGKNRF